MPAAVRTRHAIVNSASAGPSKPQERTKKRVVKRRGRTQRGLESDDEFEREAATDSESEQSDSSVDSESEPETEPLPKVDGEKKATAPPESSFFASSGNWSEMVADESEAASELPVIDFGELGISETVPKAIPKGKADSADIDHDNDAEQSVGQPSPPGRTISTVKRPVGQTARQAYQNRLESDPSYVPKVGEFWGHDDRLLDKDLRSLSGWWRGKWQGRGRGGYPPRGMLNSRGRGGLGLSRSSTRLSVDENDSSLSPVDKAWGHDGFEEMKKREERRRTPNHLPPAANGFTSPFQSPRRGFVPGRGRGSPFRRNLPFAPPEFRARQRPIDRPWFSQKPEQMWTKQQEGFLFNDPSAKPHNGQAPLYRVKLDHRPADLVRSSITSLRLKTSLSRKVKPTMYDDGEGFIVKLPHPRQELVSEHYSGSEQPLEVSEAVASSPPSSVQLGTVPFESQPVPASIVEPPVPADAPQQHSTPSAPAVGTNFSQPGTYTAPSQPYDSASYGYPTTLPPGVALNHLGMPFEIATGRPVYIPSPPMYDPNAVMTAPPPPAQVNDGVRHVRHFSSVTPDFVQYASQQAPPAPPVQNGYMAPSSFSYPRQTTRVEIKSPTVNGTTSAQSSKNDQSTKRPGHRSNLSVAAPVFEPSSGKRTPQVESSFPTIQEAPVQSQVENEQAGYDPAVYATMYHQTQGGYYYPDAGYGYTQMPPSYGVPQEMYPPADPQYTHQGAVYYQ